MTTNPKLDDPIYRRTVMRIATALLLFTLAATAVAQEQTYSAEEKLKMFRTLNATPASSSHSVEWGFGYVTIHAFGMDWRFVFLPIMAPLPGSRPQDAATIPNAFDLTRTPYATTLPPMFDEPERSRAVQRERARIERLSTDNQ
jgi:hypothetical protein